MVANEGVFLGIINLDKTSAPRVYKMLNIARIIFRMFFGRWCLINSIVSASPPWIVLVGNNSSSCVLLTFVNACSCTKCWPALTFCLNASNNLVNCSVVYIFHRS